MKVSIIIPTYNEANSIRKVIDYLKQCPNCNEMEIIVSDGNSSDNTLEIIQEKGGVMALICPEKGRAAQMNYGAKHATGDILYFLHADSYPPRSFYKDIIKCFESGRYAGCFKLSFDCNHWFLKLNCWFTRFNIDSFRFGDQSLFISKDIFMKCGGFNENLIVMEDNEIVTRIRKFTKMKVINKPILSSARKYMENGIIRLQFIYGYLYLLYRIGYSQEDVLKKYHQLITQDKI